MSNTHLHKAKKAKNDCFYTRREDVEKELAHYEDQLEGKWIYMPFDTEKSAFWQYFKDNFNKLKLKHITATSWYQDNEDGKGHRLDYDGETETNIILEGNGSYILNHNAPLECLAPRFVWSNYNNILASNRFKNTDKGLNGR